MYQHIVIVMLLIFGLIEELSSLYDPRKILQDRQLLMKGEPDEKREVLARKGCTLMMYFLFTLLAMTTDQWLFACMLFILGLIPKAKLASKFGVWVIVVDAILSIPIIIFAAVNHFMLQIPYNLWAKAWLISVFNPS